MGTEGGNENIDGGESENNRAMIVKKFYSDVSMKLEMYDPLDREIYLFDVDKDEWLVQNLKNNQLKDFI